MGVQLSECEKFVERVQKRFASHEVRCKLVLEFQLSKLRAEDAKVRLFSTRLGSGGGLIAADGHSHRAQCCCPGAEIHDTRRFWSPHSGCAVDALLVLPSDPRDLERWLLDRHADLRDVLEFTDCGSVAKLAALLLQGGAKLHAMSEAGTKTCCCV